MFKKIQTTLHRLTFLGERVAVGGCVRDELLGIEPHDIDVATPLLPQEIIKRAQDEGIRALPTGLAHGTVTLLLGGDAVEVTTYRRDVTPDGRHSGVAFAKTLEEDLARRDFTINAVAVDHTGKLIDPFGGRADLEARHLRTVGNPDERFAEDYLRVVRAHRFAARFAMALEPATVVALDKAAPEVIKHVSVERFVDELRKAFAYNGAGHFIRELYRIGVLQAFIPDFTGMDALGQNPLHHPEGNVLTHVCLVIDNAPMEYRFHALLHDIGKSACAEPAESGPWFSFIGHERVGAEMIPRIAEALKLSGALTESLVVTTRYHMHPLHLWAGSRELSDRTIRRFQSAAGVHLGALAALCKADRMGRTGPTDAFLESLFAPLASDELTPALKGRHLVTAGWTPGPHFTAALARAFDYQLETGCTDIPTLLDTAKDVSPI